MQATSNLTYLDIPIFNQLVPKEGPKAIAVNCDFSLQTSYSIDFGNIQSRAFIKEIQTVYVDNSASTVAVSIDTGNTYQTIIVPGKSQGYFPVLSPNPPRFIVQSAGAQLVKFQFLNVPMPAAVWSTTQTAPIFNGSGALIVSDPILDASLGTSPVPVLDESYYNGDVPAPNYKGSRTARGALTTITPVTIFTGAPGFVLTGVDLRLSGNATVTVNAEITVIIKSGATVLLQYPIFVTTTAPATSQTQSLVSTYSLNLFGRTANDALTINLDTALTAGSMFYNVVYSASGASSVGL